MISDVLSYYRTRLKTLGRVEWADVAFEAIPKTRLNSVFHLKLGDIRGVKNNQDHQEIEVTTAIRIPYAPALRPTDLINSAVVYADSVIADLLKAGNRLTHVGVRNIAFNTMSVDPLADSNDNGIIIVLNFTALVMISTR